MEDKRTNRTDAERFIRPLLRPGKPPTIASRKAIDAGFAWDTINRVLAKYESKGLCAPRRVRPVTRIQPTGPGSDYIDTGGTP